MKKIQIISLFALLSVLSMQTLNAQISQQEAWSIVKNEVLGNKTENVNVFVSKNILDGKSPIKTLYKDGTSPVLSSWFFFIDDRPFASWSHPCRYVYVNSKSGKVIVKNKKLPPLLDNMESLVEQKIYTKGKLFDFSKKRTRNVATSANDYAVIISGGANRDINWERYWNHCSAIYSALVNVYGYADDHIYVLMSDGTDPANDRHMRDGSYTSSPLDLDGDGDNDVQFSATKANITNVFNTLSNILTPNDNLFIYTTDHGFQNSGMNVSMCLWHENITDAEFASEVNKVNAKTINICMVQCNSGGFIDNLEANNRIIATSCKYDEGASAMPPNYLYSEFTYHWISAVAGETPYGTPVNADTNNDGFVSMREAFNYARNHDTRPESPQYSSMLQGLGENLSLLGEIHCITGLAQICEQATYTITNLPAGAAVTWSASNDNIQLVSGQGTSTAVFKGKMRGNSSVKATISISGTNIALEKPVWIPLPEKPSNIIGFPYNGMNFGSNSYYNFRINSLPNQGASSYEWSVGGGTIVSGQGTNWITVLTGNANSGNNIYFNVDVKAVNDCGCSPTFSRTGYVVKGEGPAYKVYPNPAKDYVIVSFDQKAMREYAERKGQKAQGCELVIYDNYNQIMYKTRTSEDEIQIDTRNFPAGTYYLHVTYGDKTEKSQLVIE